MSRFRAVVSAFCLLLCVGLQAQEVRLVTGDGYAPYTAKSLPEGGMLALVVRKAFESRGMTSSVQWRPWNRGFLQTQSGQFDATFPYIVSPERQALFLYSDPLYIGEQFIFSRAGEPIDSATPETLSGKRFCYPLGWQAPEPVEQLLKAGKLRRHSPQGMAECAQLLLLKRDDFFMAERHMGAMVLEQLGAAAEQFTHSSEPINRNTLHLVIPKSLPNAQQLMSEFNQGLAALHASGEYQRLLDDYLRRINEHVSVLP
ncbi:transporter substrate-binding domain-containing protein [Ectopseudomonas mendocina]|uniref:Transporter substrate-binding domain-containing protein n=1 Tax=Ectopseudomonas mendocina TaxID=300 RepID=A0ABZ2RI88_ECTME